MKKSILLFIFFILLLSAPLSGADRVDMIVLLDNSISVLPYYDEIQTSLLRKIVSEHLAPGDSFSLITFADVPEVEVAREIKSRDDIENILAYSSLLQPMGSHTDLIMALRYLYKYTLDLPLNNRKKIVILTDGIHDPAEGSPYYHRNDDEVRAEIEKAADDIHRQGWDVSIVEIQEESILPGFEKDEGTGVESVQAAQTGQSGLEPSDQAASGSTGEKSVDSGNDGRVDVLDEVSENLGSTPNIFDTDEEDMAGIALGTPLVSVEGHLGTTSGELTVPLNILNRSNEPILFSLSEIISSGNDILKRKASVEIDPGESARLKIVLVLPEGLAEGEQNIKIRPVLVSGERISPELIDLSFKYEVRRGIAGGAAFFFDWKIIAIIAALILAAVIIVILRRTSRPRQTESGPAYVPDSTKTAKKSKTADETDAEAVYAPHTKQTPVHIAQQAENLGMMSLENPDSANEAHIIRKNRPIHMFVFGQNTKSGVSNVKWLGLNRKRAIGGGTNAFFRIFFVKVPAVLAEIECNDEEFIFYPKVAEYFPELDGPLHPCLNRKIMVVTPEEKIFFIEFRQWVSKLEKLNRLLAMTKTAGSPDLEF